MATWRDFILKEFVPNVSKLTLVADPDGLLTEEKLVIELAQRGFELVEFTDPVEFRYVYELNYRSIWDRGENTDLVIILRLQNNELASLPYDLLHKGRRLAFDLGALFPNLSYPVLEQFDRGMLDLLFEAQTQFSPARLGDKATKDFMLKHVFNIETDLLTTEVAFLRILLRLHYNKLELPTLLAEHLIQVLREYTCFKHWPLAEVVPDARAFFDFLQERWPLFLAHFRQDNAVSEETHSKQLTYSGPTLLPFDHEDIRVYIDNLFVEGKLKPVLAPKSFMHSALWLKSGLLEPGPEEDKKRLTRLFQHLQEHIPTKSCRHSAWLDFAQKYAELAAQVHCGADIVAKAKLKRLSLECNAN